MNRIFKYQCKSLVSNKDTIEMPVGAIVRHAGYLAGLYIWAEHDMKVTKTEKRTFMIVETGEAFVSEGKVFINTILLDGTVWHIYEIDF